MYREELLRPRLNPVLGFFRRPSLLRVQFTSLACYMSAKVDHYNKQYESPAKYCAFGGPPAASDLLAKDMYYSSCVSLQGLSDVILPGDSFYQTCNYPGK